jgi:hypothetical protein
MKESLWGYWLIVLGIFVITVLLLIQNLTSQNTHDYYAVKEITEASIIDAIDYGYYEDYGEIRIVKEKFVESFLERFSETANLSNTYKVTFYDIYEVPPKVSLKVSSTSSGFNIVGETSTFDIVNNMDMLLETSPERVAAAGGRISPKGCVDCVKVRVSTINGSTYEVPDVIDTVSGYSRYTIISDETDRDACKTITAVFAVNDANTEKIGYSSFNCRNYDDKSPGCEIVFPRIIKTNGNVNGWRAQGGSTVYKPGSKATITTNTTFVPVY